MAETALLRPIWIFCGLLFAFLKEICHFFSSLGHYCVMWSSRNLLWTFILSMGENPWSNIFGWNCALCEDTISINDCTSIVVLYCTLQGYLFSQLRLSSLPFSKRWAPKASFRSTSDSLPVFSDLKRAIFIGCFPAQVELGSQTRFMGRQIYSCPGLVQQSWLNLLLEADINVQSCRDDKVLRLGHSVSVMQMF